MGRGGLSLPRVTRVHAMSEHNIHVDLMLIRDGDSWITWCPAIDTVTCGANPENAVGMAIDAIRLVVEDDLAAFRLVTTPEGDPIRVAKRVDHPLRRGRMDRVSTDEHWPIYQDFLHRRESWRHPTSMTIRDLIPGANTCVVCGSVTIRARGGIVHALPAFAQRVVVPVVGGA